MRQKTYSLKPARRRSGFFYDISIDRFVKERLAFYAEAARFFKVAILLWHPVAWKSDKGQPRSAQSQALGET